MITSPHSCAQLSALVLATYPVFRFAANTAEVGARCPVSASLPHLFSLSGGSPLMNRKVRALIKLLAEMNLSDVLMHF